MSSIVSTKRERYSADRLHSYQRRAVKFILARERCALWADMGTGKTAATIHALEYLINSFVVARVLIVAPLRVARATWPDELDTWEAGKLLTYQVLAGLPPKKRADALSNDVEIDIINRENVEWLVKTLGDHWPYDCVVIDEASSFKSPSSKRFKALRRPILNTPYVIQLTGTPSPNGLIDLWPQIYMLDRGSRLGRTMTAYKERYFTQSYNGFSWEPRESAEREIHEVVADLVLRIDAHDYLDLPDRVSINYPIELPPDAVKTYAELEREFIAEIDGLDEQVAVFSAATLTNKLLQCAQGGVYGAEDEVTGNKPWAELHTAKLEALDDIVEAAAGEPILVAYSYRFDLARLKARYSQAVELDQDPETIARWNRGEIKMLITHPASAGHGLNLQRGGAICVWFGLNWSLELYQQFNARLHRQGQTRPVMIYHIVARHTIDETVLHALTNKAKSQLALLNAVKRDIAERQKVRNDEN